MMDIQRMLDGVDEVMAQIRAQYHLTLGELIDVLEALPADTLVRYNDGRSPYTFSSYRGHYRDLALQDANGITAGTLLVEARRADGQMFIGYKGGEFTMTRDTPLWRSEYGEASGVAIIGAEMTCAALTLTTKAVGG